MSVESEAADALIEQYSRYLEAPPAGYSSYAFWLQSEEAAHPGITLAVVAAARSALASTRGPILRSAMQALACHGDARDVATLARMQGSVDPTISSEASEAIRYIQHRMKSPEELLDDVDSRESFIAFVEALAREREAAEKLEREAPQRYLVDGALNWKNADIASFLYAALTRFNAPRGDDPPGWRTFAEFLYHGKIIE